MGINWKVRIKNKMFWISVIPALLLLVQVVAAAFGCSIELDGIGDRLIDVVNAVFSLLTILGVVTDPTTRGVGDSYRALTYTEPK